jgi:serine protease
MPTGPVPKVAFAVEYYYAALDHYFMTSDPSEMNALDTGRFFGWQRTGMGFSVVDASDTATAMAASVCRYYGNPSFGLDTHFYSASVDECAAVQRNWPQQWVLESSNVFRVYMPDSMSGACPAGTLPVYRSWNRRVDTNHRYTMDSHVQMTMMGRGNIAEGYGNPPVAMCSPQ